MIPKLVRREPELLLALFAVAVLFPSVNYLLFSGLPLGSPIEFAVLILLLPMIVSKRIRRLYRMALLSRGQKIRLIVLASILLVLMVKAILLAGGTYEGFLACYRSTLNDPPAGTCEKSYENPFARFHVTRIDRNLNFDAHKWNLSFFNSHRFNFYAWEEGTISRERMPFAVVWLGNLSQRTEDMEIRITYIGEGNVNLSGGETIPLPPSYGALAAESFRLPAATETLTITYRFDDGYRVGQPDDPGPYALFSINAVSSATSSVESDIQLVARPSAVWLVLGYGADLVILAAVVGIVAFYIYLLRRDWLILAIAGALGLAVMNLPEFAQLPRTRAIVPVFWILFGSLMLTRHRRRLITCYFALAFLAVVRVSLFEPDLGTVQIRGGGSDFLTYESFARTILDTGSLRAGEDIFYFQPLFRYIAFAEHMVIGDGDGFIAALALLGSTFGVFYLYDRLDISRRSGRRDIIVAGTAGLLLLTLVTSWDVVFFFHVGASEFPTWILLPYIVVFLFVLKDRFAWTIGVMLVGISLLMRFNHALALVVLLFAFTLSLGRRKLRMALALWIGFAAIALLPALHNIIFGRELVVVPTSASNLETQVLPPGVLVREIGDPGVRAEALRQFERLFYLGELAVQTSGLGLAIHGLQFIFLISLVKVARNWGSISWIAKLLVVVPLMHLGIQFFFVLDAVYPRHILMAHLSMGVVAMFVFSPYAYESALWSPES